MIEKSKLGMMAGIIKSAIAAHPRAIARAKMGALVALLLANPGLTFFVVAGTLAGLGVGICEEAMKASAAREASTEADSNLG